jgi:tRNA(fMet)-specific endonuclease VapC
MMIAATAIANELTLVTHNVREYSRVPGLQWDDWEQLA